VSPVTYELSLYIPEDSILQLAFTRTCCLSLNGGHQREADSNFCLHSQRGYAASYPTEVLTAGIHGKQRLLGCIALSSNIFSLMFRKREACTRTFKFEFACHMLFPDYLLVSVFIPEDGGSRSLRNDNELRSI
jgi:hypothetical protein